MGEGEGTGGGKGVPQGVGREREREEEGGRGYPLSRMKGLWSSRCKNPIDRSIETTPTLPTITHPPSPTPYTLYISSTLHPLTQKL